MKKLILSLIALSCLSTGYAQQFPKAKTAKSNTGMTIDAGIGVGSVYTKSKAMFTQRIGAEWCVMPEFLVEGVSLAAGIYINNNCGGGFETRTVGTFDYYYTIYSKSDRTGKTTSTQHRRQGSGMADVMVCRDDISFLPTASLRYQVNPKLEAYFSFGIGLSIMNTYTGGYSNPTGFDKADVSNKSDYGAVALTYKYNDLDHVKWADLTWTKASFAIATYIGARYFITDNWGVNAQLGLISANVRESVGNSYNVLSFGATYRF